MFIIKIPVFVYMGSYNAFTYGISPRSQTVVVYCWIIKLTARLPSYNRAIILNNFGEYIAII